MKLSEIDFRHSFPIQLRFNDVDGLRHVNNVKFGEYFDLGRMHYFSRVRGERFSWESLDLVVASIKTDFFSPIEIHELIEVKSKIQKVGDKSLEMIQVITNEAGQIKALSTSVMVGFNGVESMSISPELRQQINTFEGVE